MWVTSLILGLFWSFALGEQQEGCHDMLPDWSWYNCQQQYEYNKCEEYWMKKGNFCAKSCGRCSDDDSNSDQNSNSNSDSSQNSNLNENENEIEVVSEKCTDVAPDSWYSCEQQKEFGKCEDWWFAQEHYCDRTCNRCSEQVKDKEESVDFSTAVQESASVIVEDDCFDTRPDFMWYTCEEEKSFGKCEEWWMKEGDYCAMTCGRCTPKNNLTQQLVDATADTDNLESTTESTTDAIDELKIAQYEGKYDYDYYLQEDEENILQVSAMGTTEDTNIQEIPYSDNSPLSEERIKQIEEDLEQCKNELANDYVDFSSDQNFVKTQGVQFVKDNQIFPFIGFNLHDLMKIAANESTRYRVELAFQKAQELNLKVCRVFAFTDGEVWQPEFFDLIRGTQFWQEPRALQTQPGVYDEEMFQALDYVVHMASQYDILLLPVMTNYWPGYGGAAQYIKWIHGSDTTWGHTIDQFYSDYLPRMLLQRFMCELVRRTNTYSGLRYRDDPTIMAWSLINEARCPECSMNEPKDQVLYDWISDMSAFLKSIDKNHLVSAGTEGFFGNSAPEYLIYNPGGWPNCEGTDFMRQHQIPNIDFATIRMYDRLKTWDYDNHRECNQECFVKWAEQSLNGHLKAAQQLNMPLVIEEFGELVAEEVHKNERNHLLHLVMQTMFESAVSGGPGMGALFWQAGVAGSIDWDNYTIYLDSSPKIKTPLYTLDFTTEEEAAFRREPQQTACYPSQDVTWEANYYANKHNIELEPLRIPNGIKQMSDLEVIKLHAGNFAALRTPVQL